jgi:hypothetical protein
MITNKLSSSSRFLPSSKPLLRGGAMLLACCSLFLTMTGCHSSPSPDHIGDVVKGSMQSTFDTDPNFTFAHFKVDKVVAVKKSDTEYDGTATIQYQGAPHQVPVHITLDASDNASWKTDPGALSFAAAAPTPANTMTPSTDQQ